MWKKLFKILIYIFLIAYLIFTIKGFKKEFHYTNNKIVYSKIIENK